MKRGNAMKQQKIQKFDEATPETRCGEPSAARKKTTQ
jgi:hypothetical protein